MLDQGATNGAEFTLTHVTRSGLFLERYLPRIGLQEFTPLVSRVVHFTGYEKPIEHIEPEVQQKQRMHSQRPSSLARSSGL